MQRLQLRVDSDDNVLGSCQRPTSTNNVQVIHSELRVALQAPDAVQHADVRQLPSNPVPKLCNMSADFA